jgi:hypothetical protein
VLSEEQHGGQRHHDREEGDEDGAEGPGRQDPTDTLAERIQRIHWQTGSKCRKRWQCESEQVRQCMDLEYWLH